MTTKNQQEKRWKVPTSIKVAIGLFGFNRRIKTQSALLKIPVIDIR